MDSTEASLLILLLFLCLLASAYFSLLETALTESHRSKLEKIADEDESKRADVDAAIALLDAPEETFDFVQMGIAFTSILLGLGTGVFLTPLLAGLLVGIPHAGLAALLISILGMTYVSLVFSEFLPKKAALQKPEHFLLHHQKRLLRLTHLAHPFTIVFSKSANFLLVLFGMNPNAQDVVTEDEVKDLIEQGTEDGTFEKSEQDLVGRIFRLSDQTVSALMTPRTQMSWLDLEDDLAKNLACIAKSHQDIFPAGRENLDDFAGILHARELLDAALSHKEIRLEDYIRKPMFLPRSMDALRALEKLQSSGIHEAVILDEYGGVIGILTMENVLSEILGDPEGEITDPVSLRPHGDHSWYVDGLYGIDDFKEQFALDELPEEEHDQYQTMGGFVTSLLGRIPRKGDIVTWNDFTFKILAMDRARVDKIHMTRKPPAPPTGDEKKEA
ncbi:MAG: hemolysin family protein [Selenomonadaceae bacterium]|nr:hemolysin family protein [Selenomonadaceae bacterium]MDY2684944.1 hemolysin family protein [Selenomonadaceae bacterium]